MYWADAWSVSFRFVLWFLVLPALMMPRTLGRADRFAFGFAIFTASAIFVMQALSFLKLYDPFGFWGLVMILLGMGLARRKPRGETWERIWVRTLDRVEDQSGQWLAILGRWFRHWLQVFRGSLRTVFSARGLLWLVGAAVVGWAAWLRFYPYLRFSYLGHADAYVHLVWMKYLESLTMYRDGVYPYGYHAVAAALGSLTFLDRFLLFRFLGPLSGVLVVLSVAYAATRLQLRGGAVILSVAIFGLMAGTALPDSIYRQAHPLPEEFATMFLLPGAILAWQYLRTGDRLSGVGAGLTAFVTAAVYPYTSAYLGVILVVITLAGWATRSIPFQRGLRLLGASAAVAGLTFIPMGMARLLGRPWHGFFPYTEGSRFVAPFGEAWWWLLRTDLVFTGGLALALGLLVWGITGRRRGDRDHAPLALALAVLLLVLMVPSYFQTNLGFFSNPTRTGAVFSLFFALAVGMAFDRLLARMRAGFGAQVLIVALLVATITTLRPPQPAYSVQLEYEDAVKAFNAITRSFPRLLWTIVGPVEQYSQVLGIGWHEEIGQFILRVRDDNLADPNYKLYIPSPDVFIYVEKIPLYNEAPIEPDPAAPVNFENIGDPDVLYRRYQDPEQRRYIEQRAWAIVEEYAKGHPGEVTIFFESERLRVYRIHHEPESIHVVPTLAPPG